MNTNARVTYDPEADAVAIRLPKPGAVYRDSEEVAPGVIVDYAEDGHVIGVQVLDLRDLLETGERAGPVKVPAA
jgi:uncharacterized protein YuzE